MIHVFWVPAIFTFFALVEMALGVFFQQNRSSRYDISIEVVSTLVFTLAIVPFIFIVSKLAIKAWAPHWLGALADWPMWAMFAILLVADDMVQYWWHRTAHSSTLLYNFHRAHHSGEYMSVRVVYRNNLFYYLFLPGLWFSSILFHAGFGLGYAIYASAKMTVIIGAHSSVRWDRFLYARRWLHPLAWVIERTISTPATHFAHHGKYQSDGLTNYEGNYGNFLFFWDVLFGTAKITRRYPDEYGVENLPDTRWQQELLFPLVRGTECESVVTTREPTVRGTVE